MELIFLSYFPAIVGLCLLGLVTYINNPTARLNRLFTLFVALVASWQFMLFLADTATTDMAALWQLRIALAVGTPIGLVFLLFCDSFPSPQLRVIGRRTIIVFSIATAIFASLSLSELIVPSIARTDTGVTLELTTLYSLQTLLLFIEMMLGIIIIIRRRKSVSVVQRYQIRFFSLGTIIAIAINAIPGFIFVVLDISGSLTALLTSVSFLVLSLFMWVAITRYEFFSIRGVVARAAAYVISALVVAALYAMTVGVILEQYVESQTVQVIFTGVSLLVTVALFNRVKTLFDRLTNRLFYREAYSSRKKLDLLTDSLVSYIDLAKLAKVSGRVLKDTLRPQKFSLVVFSNKTAQTYGHQINADQLFLKIAASDKAIRAGQFILTDTSERDDAQLLRAKGVEMVVPIQSANDLEGLIMLGPRSSGEVYSRQDMAFLKIAARNIGLAIHNAKSYQEIAEFNKTLRGKVRKATKELRVKNSELEGLHKTKDEFISMASHQLRPQLAAADGFIGLVSSSPKSKLSKYELENLTLASASIRKMTHVVFGVLEAAYKDMPHIQLTKKPTDIVQLIRDEEAQMKHYVQARTIALSVPKNTTRLIVGIDADKIKEVIYNLLRNAIDYSPSDQPISIDVREEGKNIVVSVKDRGIGITKKDLKNIFDKFYRSEKASKARPDGTGMGLHVVKLFVEAHGGSVHVTSTVGSGSMFQFALPLE